ncbi:MAG: hypothetical protein ACE14M_10005 [Terriglobales bacterium]
MKGFAVLTILALVLVPAAFAQNHGEFGVFAEYFRLHSAGDLNFVGIGGRASFNASTHIALEGEMGYDFERTFNNVFSNGITFTTVRSNLSLLHGLFGPKIQTGGGALRAFLTAKGGFLNFRGGAGAATLGNFAGQVALVPVGDTNGAMFAGGGVEGFLGPVGLRLDIGDEIYWDEGANHNLKVTLGPHIRF